MYNDKIFLLTWKSKKGFVYDKNTFDKIDEFDYKTEGWGVTTVNDKIVMSDGTENLYFINPNTYKIENQIQVYDNNGKVININELEFINDKIYANVYGKDIILIINYSSGKVENFINLDNVFNKKNYNGKIDVLNGIATNNNKIYVYRRGIWMNQNGKKWNLSIICMLLIGIRWSWKEVKALRCGIQLAMSI